MPDNADKKEARLRKQKPSLSDRFWRWHTLPRKTQAEKETELCFSVMRNDLWRVMHLIEIEKIPVDIKSNLPIRWAAEGGNVEMIMLLIERGADINAEDGKPLIRATVRGHTEGALFLMEQGADVRRGEFRALKFASETNNLVLLKAMLERGGHETPELPQMLDRARKRKFGEQCKLFEKYLPIQNQKKIQNINKM